MAEARRDYYEVLGIPPDADARAIKDAFRKLALQYHPDRNKSPGAEERFKEIAEAYAVLSDPEKRAVYDARGFAGVEGLSAEDLFGGIDFGSLFRDFGLGFDLGGGLFERLFGRRGRGPAGPSGGADLTLELTVSLERVGRGGRETVRLARPQACTACRGTGARAGKPPHRCDSCQGTGQRVVSGERGGFRIQQITTCSACRGRGSVIDEPCPECSGRGQVERPETLEITIPPGVEEGTALRIPGHGLPGAEKGAPPGDLYVVLRIAADPRFERRGADLWRSESIAVHDAVLGTRLVVPTLDGSAEVAVPPGTQPGSVLRLRGKGLPRPGGGRRGDLHVQVLVGIPEAPSREERDLYERLRSLAGGRDRSAR
jgi:molecular chaperone DnaJ